MNNKKKYIHPSLETTEADLKDAVMLNGSGPGLGGGNTDDADKTNKKHRQRSIWDAQSGDMWK